MYTKGFKTYLKHMYHVPVCPPKELTWVDTEVRKKSLTGLVAAAEKPKLGSEETPGAGADCLQGIGVAREEAEAVPSGHKHK